MEKQVKQKIDTFEKAVEYLYNMPRFTSKHTLEDTRAHLERLGSPDKKVRNIIHVAGTNGKGSVCTYLRYCLEEAGYRVGVFTSPHLVDIRERFLLAGEMISAEDFLLFFTQVYESLDWESLERGEGYHPTFFEYLFFMCMLYFAKMQPDYCILETGLGGRLDATNAVSHKALAVITRIGLDHVEYLGNTLAEIAAEKAGILCPDTPLVYCDEVPEAAEVFVRKVRELGIPAFPVSKKDYSFYKIHNKTIDFSLQTRYYGYIGVSLHTIARYQMENAAIAVCALEVLRARDERAMDSAGMSWNGAGTFMDEGEISGEGVTGTLERRLTVACIRNGLAKAFWPGRMEELLPEIYADGAHNADGIRAFLETVGEDGCGARGQERSLVFSVVQDKDYGKMINQVLAAGLFTRIYVAHMHTARAAELTSLKKYWEENAGEGTGVQIFFYQNVREALEAARAAQNGARIYIAGSLYLVGEIKEFFKDDQF